MGHNLIVEYQTEVTTREVRRPKRRATISSSDAVADPDILPSTSFPQPVATSATLHFALPLTIAHHHLDTLTNCPVLLFDAI